MVVVNSTRLHRELKRRDWSEERLAAEMGVHFNTVRNLLSGASVSHATQLALFNALQGHVPFTKLFMVSPGPDTQAAEQAKERVA
jgi:transcriptional regulator with XRE-family HTH domain